MNINLTGTDRMNRVRKAKIIKCVSSKVRKDLYNLTPKVASDI